MGKYYLHNLNWKSCNRWILPNWCSTALILNKHLNHTNTTCSNYQEIKSFVWPNSLYNNFKSHDFDYEIVPKRSANSGHGAVCRRWQLQRAMGDLLTLNITRPSPLILSVTSCWPKLLFYNLLSYWFLNNDASWTSFEYNNTYLL